VCIGFLFVVGSIRGMIREGGNVSVTCGNRAVATL
jgi:hypothetical protein